MVSRVVTGIALRLSIVFISGTLVVFDSVHCSLDCHFRLAFTPSLLEVHCDGAVLIVAGEKGLIQCFDLALGNIR